MSAVNKSTKPAISEQISELDELISWFDGDDFTLDAAFDHYKKAEELAAAIDTRLKDMKNEVTVLKQRFDEE